mmetsp:Transcript_27553/g.64293  ORF Transcript_27553/g.64293 Transcript_27553/m.64293 type:complete len:205 (+) Transcript_27553:406-1020(+)
MLAAARAGIRRSAGLTKIVTATNGRRLATTSATTIAATATAIRPRASATTMTSGGTTIATTTTAAMTSAATARRLRATTSARGTTSAATTTGRCTRSGGTSAARRHATTTATTTSAGATIAAMILATGWARRAPMTRPLRRAGRSGEPTKRCAPRDDGWSRAAMDRASTVGASRCGSRRTAQCMTSAALQVHCKCRFWIWWAGQ